MRTYAQLTTSYVVFVNRVGVEESISFWGGSEVIGPDGAAVFSAPFYDEALYPVDDRPGRGPAGPDRPAAAARRAARARGPRARPDRRRAGRAGGRRDGGARRRARPRRRPSAGLDAPTVTSATFELPAELAIDTDVARRVIGEFIRGQLRQAGFERAVVGLSGGIDSALVAYLVAEAIGAERLLCVLMPYRTSSPASRADAEEVVRRLGCASELVEISADGRRLLRAGWDRRRARAGGARGDPAAARQLHGPDADGRAVRPLGHLARARRRDRQQDRVADRLHDPVRGQRVAPSTRSATCTRARSASWRRRSACPTRSSPRRRRPTCGRARPTRPRPASATRSSTGSCSGWSTSGARPRSSWPRASRPGWSTWAVRAVAGAEFKRQVPPIAKLGPRTAGIDYLYPRRRPGSTRS